MGITAVLLALTAFAAPASAAPGCFDTAGISCAASGAAAAPAAPEAVPAPDAAGPMSAMPVVISIVGIDFAELGIGKLEIRYFSRIIEHFAGEKTVSTELFDRKMEAIKENMAECGAFIGYPDDYLDARLAEALPPGKFTIAPIRWSRDPDESDAAVPLVKAGIKRIVSAARMEGRPVYLVAHSWGTMLAHTALKELAVSDPAVKIDKLVTLGSPLVPGSWWLDIFVEHELNAGHLQSYVSKPANVADWTNLWARNDAFSNEIKAADKNILVDGETRTLEAQIKAALQADHSIAAQAARDLVLLKNIKGWHFAYIFDFKVFLKTIKKDFSAALFAPLTAEELAYSKQ